MKKLIKFSAFMLSLALLLGALPLAAFASYGVPTIETVEKELGDAGGTLVYDTDFEGVTMTPAGTAGNANTTVNISGHTETVGKYFSAKTVRDFWVNDGYRNLYTDGHSLIWRAHDNAFTSPNGSNNDDNNNFELTLKSQPAGEDFVISFGITMLADALTSNVNFFAYCNSATTQIKSTPLVLKKDGTLTAGSTDIVKLAKGESTHISLHVRIVEPDASLTDDKGSVRYDVYLNGMIAAKDLYFVSTADQARISKVDRSNSAVSSAENNTGLSTDYKLTYVRFLHTSGTIKAADTSGASLGANGADLFSLDSVRMYYSDTCYDAYSTVKHYTLERADEGYEIVYTLDLIEDVASDPNALVRLTSPSGTVTEIKISDLTQNSDGTYTVKAPITEAESGNNTLELISGDGTSDKLYQYGKSVAAHTAALDALKEDLNTFDAVIMSVYGGRQAIVSLTFDDSVYPSALVVEELCEKYGMQATMMMWCSRIGISGSDYADAETWAKLFAKGYLEPQSHSTSHMDLRSSTTAGAANQSEANYKTQIVDSKTTLEQLFPEYDCITYGIPFGSMSAEAKAVARATYYALRGVSGADVQSLDPAIGTGNGTWGQLYAPGVVKKDSDGNLVSEDEQLAYLKGWIDKTVTAGGWYSPYIHKVGDVSGTEMTYKVIDGLFAYIDTYQESGSVWVTTFSSAVKYVRERQNTTPSVRYDGEKLYLTLTMAEKTEDDLPLTSDIFDQPLTVKVELPSDYEKVYYTLNGNSCEADVFVENGSAYAYIDALPNGIEVAISDEPNAEVGGGTENGGNDENGGGEDVHEHLWQSFEKADAKEHVVTCECGASKLAPHTWNDGEVSTPATHTAQGVLTYTCSDCDEKKTDSIPTSSEHVYDQRTVKDEYLASIASCTAMARYYYSCACGERGSSTFAYGEDPHGHIFGEWVTIQDMTKDTPCIKERRCSVCGDTEEYVIPLPGAYEYTLIIGDAIIGRKGATSLIISLISMG